MHGGSSDHRIGYERDQSESPHHGRLDLRRSLQTQHRADASWTCPIKRKRLLGTARTTTPTTSANRKSASHLVALPKPKSRQNQKPKPTYDLARHHRGLTERLLRCYPNRVRNVRSVMPFVASILAKAVARSDRGCCTTLWYV
jgi:hypothetical protein